ncbi:hypothetical protein BMS3Bbin04_00750 [bacterium BMS3Bbin04]|nr:hypothetical protein BMS3Bbin04_00750 [bacterium BMS3Bbin04]
MGFHLILVTGLLVGVGACLGQIHHEDRRLSEFTPPSIEEQFEHLSEYSREAYPHLRALAETDWIIFPDVYVVTIEPVDSIPEDMALIDINDTRFFVHIQSNLGIIAHWHSGGEYSRRYQVLVPAGQQTLSVYFDESCPIHISIDLPSGHVLKLEHDLALLDSSGYISLGYPEIEIDYAFSQTVFLGQSGSLNTWVNTSLPIENWPQKAVREGITGKVQLQFDIVSTGEVKHINDMFGGAESADVRNLKIRYEETEGWGFADSAKSVVENASWEFTMPSFAYAPYRIWLTISFGRDRLPWENQVRGLQSNKQLVLVPFTFPDEFDTLRIPETYRSGGIYGTYKKYAWLLIEGPDPDLTIQCKYGVNYLKQVSDSTTLLRINSDYPFRISIQSSNGQHFTKQFASHSPRDLPEAVRIESPDDSSIYELKLNDVIIGDKQLSEQYSCLGVPLFNLPIDSNGVFQGHSTIVPSSNENESKELLRQIILQEAYTYPVGPGSGVFLELIIDYDLQRAIPNEPMPVSIKGIRVLKESPENNNYAEVARRYMREQGWQFQAQVVTAWKNLPENLQPVPPDTIKYGFRIPSYRNINKPLR